MVDIENLLGVNPKIATKSHYRMLARGYRAILKPRPGDHFYVGCNPANAFKAQDAFPKASLRSGHGPDGGERWLLELLKDVQFIKSRYAGVVIASGDHAFAEPVRRIVGAGIPVTVLSRTQSLSADLRQAAYCVITAEEILPGAIPRRSGSRGVSLPESLRL